MIKMIMKYVFGMSLITSIAYLILGTFLAFRPEGTIAIFSYIIGAFMILAGGNCFVRYYKTKETQGFFGKFDIVYGIISIMAGLILILNPEAVASVLPFVLGVFFCVSGAVKLQYALDIKQVPGSKWIWLMVIASLTIACGVLFVFNPFKTAKTITRIIGIFLIIYSILDIINYCILRRDMREVSKMIEMK